jgi:hypothetical protein
VEREPRTRSGAPVARIADERMSDGGEVHADLMHPSGEGLDLHERALR